MAQQVVFGFVPKVAVVAFGGNALLPRDADGTQAEQEALAREAAVWLVDIVMRGYELAIVHGNGPQLGNRMVQAEQAALQVPPATLDVATAETQGAIGFLLQGAVRNELARRNLVREVVTLLTEVEVDPDDPAFRHPGKAVGPHFNRFRARVLTAERGWTMKEDAGRGYRRVVPSPRPKRIVNVDTVRKLVCGGTVAIAGGGGGIPVVRRSDGDLAGVEAVVDKDASASLLATELKADLLIVLCQAARVTRGSGKKRDAEIPEMRLAEAKRLLKEGAFPAGSTGPKVDAAIRFVEASGGTALITDAAHVGAALAGEHGTVIRPDAVTPRKARKKAARRKAAGRRESGE
jgi:carbamate kinase